MQRTPLNRPATRYAAEATVRGGADTVARISLRNIGIAGRCA